MEKEVRQVANQEKIKMQNNSELMKFRDFLVEIMELYKQAETPEGKEAFDHAVWALTVLDHFRIRELMDDKGDKK